jgi:hypothetical protein
VTSPEASDASDSPTDKATMAPFFGALAIILLVVIGIIAFNAFGGSDATPDQQLRAAVVGQNDAMQRQDYADFRGFTCRAAQRNEADVLAGQRDSIAKSGERYVDEVSDIRIAGDRATVKVSYHFDKTPGTTSSAEVALLREDGAWKVCAP